MRKILVVAAREYKAAVRTKAFLISLVFMPVLMFGSVAVQAFLEKQSVFDDKRFAVIDRSPGGKLFDALKQAADFRNDKEIFDPKTTKQNRPRFVLEAVTPSGDTETEIKQQRLDLSEAVRKEQYWGFVEIGPKALDLSYWASSVRDRTKEIEEQHGLRYQTNHPTFEEFPSWAEKKLLVAIVGRVSGRSPEDLERQQPPTLKREGLSERNPVSGAIEDPAVEQRIAQLLLPLAMVMLMFMMVMLSSTPAMSGVVEEKMQRIAEVLLGSVSPFQLMAGKLVGLMGVSLTTAAVYLAGAYYAAYRYEVASLIPMQLLIWYVVFQCLAVLMYGSLFLAIGAAATDTKETQTLVMPVIMLACIPMFVLRNALEDPNSALVVAISFFPPSTPMLMMSRLAIQPGPAWWQPFVAMILVLAVTIGCVWAAGRIFRVGILVQGKGARLGQMLQWVIRG